MMANAEIRRSKAESPRFFVDAQRPDGRWAFGERAMPREEAQQHADQVKLEHPEWLVEINPVGPA